MDEVPDSVDDTNGKIEPDDTGTNKYPPERTKGLRKGNPGKRLFKNRERDPYLAMQHVLTEKEDKDTTELHRFFRKLKDDDAKGFLAKWLELEKSRNDKKKAQEKVPEAGVPEPEGPDSLEELATQLLADMEGEPWENE